ncbi:MAG: 50S ribosomal protein L29 [Deltaproteobacteria bacterium]|nr:50S ribosomal protein L29 [Deltaproteobacteria bacterium]
MKTTETSKLREMETSALFAKEKQKKDELFTLNIEKNTGLLTKVDQIKAAKKEIARIKTIIRERQAAEAKSAVNKG